MIMMKWVTLAMSLLALASCNGGDAVTKTGDAKSGNTAGSAAASQKPTGSAAASQADPSAKPSETASAAPAPEPPAASPDVEAGLEKARPTCTKGMTEVKMEDLTAHDTFVGFLRTPRGATPKEDAKHPFVGTKMAVVFWNDADPQYPQVIVHVTSDDTDPCELSASAPELFTSKGNPAVRIRIMGVKPGDFMSWYEKGEGKLRVEHGEVDNKGAKKGAVFRGMSLAKITAIEKGKGVEGTVQACESQAGELSFPGALPMTYYLMGPIKATWCPKLPK